MGAAAPAAVVGPVSPSPGELLALAEAAARAAADELLGRWGEVTAATVRTKSTPTDPVTEADEAAERAIRALLRERRPDDGVLGEEGGDRAGTSGVRWVVDPLDGTVNYVYGMPHWSVSVAAEDADGTVAGVVLDPTRDELFAAARDGAATLNGSPVQASGVERLEMTLVATGFAYDAGLRARQAELAARVLPLIRDLRRMGSAALDLAWAACGRYDACYERAVNAWDVDAGALCCRRAGLEVHPLAARDGLPGGLMAAPPAVAGALLALVG